MAQGAEPPPPTLSNSLALSNQQLDQQTRLLTLLRSIGHASLDSLEDFIFLHGASKLIPIQHSTSLLDSESQLASGSGSGAILNLRQEVARLQAEVQYANQGAKREKMKREQVTRDLDRLLNVALESQSKVGGGGGVGGGGEQQAGEVMPGEETQELYGQLQRAYDEIERLDREEQGREEEMESKVQEMDKVCKEEKEKRERAEEKAEEEKRRRVESEREVQSLRQRIEEMSSALGQGLPPAIAQPVSNDPPQPQPAPSDNPTPHAVPIPSSLTSAPPPHPHPAPALSTPQPLTRTTSTSAQLSLYSTLLLTYRTSLTSSRKSQSWYTNSWLPFSLSNARNLARLAPLAPHPLFLSAEEEEEEWPESLEGRSDGNELYERLEAREKEVSGRRREWEEWKKVAVGKVEEVRKLAEGEGGGGGGGGGTPVVWRKKMRRVPGTGSEARERALSGVGVGVGVGVGGGLETPTRMGGGGGGAAQVMPCTTTTTSLAGAITAQAQQLFTPAAPADAPPPQPHAQADLPLPPPTPKSNTNTNTNTNRPSSSSSSSTTKAPPHSSSNLIPPRSSSSATHPAPPQPATAVDPPSSSHALALPSPPRPPQPPTTNPPDLFSHTHTHTLMLNQTPRKTKRRSDILHLSASGHPHHRPASRSKVETRGTVLPSSRMGATDASGKDGGGAQVQPRLLREALRGALEEGKGKEKEKEKETASGRQNVKAGDLELGEEGDGDGDVFWAPPPPQQTGEGQLAVPLLQTLVFKQPESSWEPEPDTQSEGEEPAPRQEEEPPSRSRNPTPRILVPPSSADESQGSQPHPHPRLQPILPPAAAATVARPRPSAAPLVPSKHHTNRSAPPPVPAPAPSPPQQQQQQQQFDTQFLIAAAEAEEEDGDIEDERGREKGKSKRRRVEREQEDGGGEGDMPPSAQVGSRRRRFEEELEQVDSPVPAAKSTRPLPPSPPLLIKPEPPSPVLPPADDATRPRLRILGGVFGAGPAPAADWKAIEREERARKGKREGKKRGREEESSEKKEKKRRKKKAAPAAAEEEEEEEDVKPFALGRNDDEDLKPALPASTSSRSDDDREEGNTTRLRALDDTNFSDLEQSPGGEEDPDGHHWMRRLHAKRKIEVDKLRKEKARKSAPSKPAIEINPARNGGKNYHFTEVVRNKEARKHMHAHTCEGCAGYYEADERSNINHAANCKGGSSSKKSKSSASTTSKSKNHFLDERHRQMEARLQKTSRHRAQHKPDAEPPDYWQMGFPNTQRVEEINRRAEKDREEKRLYMEAQAQTDGFYRYRKD